MKIIKLIIILSMLTSPIFAENINTEKLSIKQQQHVLNIMAEFMKQYEEIEDRCSKDSRKFNTAYCRNKYLKAKKHLEQRINSGNGF